MNDILDIEIILKKQKYHPIYNIGLTIIIILLIFIYVSFIYKYKTYYIIKGTMIDSNIKILVPINDLKYIKNNNQLNIDTATYEYQISEISEELYVDEFYNNYKYIYLDIKGLDNINNYVYELKFEKENKKLIEYVKKYL